MVDRVYKKGIPALRKSLERLKKEYSGIETRTDWVGLRIEPVLRHADSLERLLQSPRFMREFSRLTKGVRMFKSDLDYLRTNVKALERILESEEGARRRRAGRISE